MELNSRKTSTYLFIGIGIAFLLIILMQFFSLRNPSPLIARMEQQREMKNLQFKNGIDSPIPVAERSTFNGLRYYPVDERYVASAVLVLDSVRDTLTLMTTTGENLPLVRMGQLEFSLQGMKHRLTAYKYLEREREGQLFVPFRDLTSGVSTYGGGRYLDLAYTDDIKIDFNTAYNPYCVYNIEYSCPLPPSENKLMIEVRAGELNFGK